MAQAKKRTQMVAFTGDLVFALFDQSLQLESHRTLIPCFVIVLYRAPIYLLTYFSES